MCGLTVQSRAARRPRPLGGELRRAAALADRHAATTSRSSATSPTSTTRSWSRRPSRAGPGTTSPTTMQPRARQGATTRSTCCRRPTSRPRPGTCPEMLELIGAADRARPRLRRRGRLGRRLLRRAVLAGVRRADPARGIDDMEAAEDADPRGKRDPRDFALWKGWKKESEPETAAWPSPVGPGPPGLAHRVLGDGAASTSAPAFDIHGGGVDLRFPHHENEQAQSRAAGHRVRVVLDAQRLDHHRRREDEQVARQLAARSPTVLERVRGDRAALLHGRGALPLARRVLASRRSTRRRPASARIEAFLDRAGELLGEVRSSRHAVRRLRARRWTTTSAPRPPSR